MPLEDAASITRKGTSRHEGAEEESGQGWYRYRCETLFESNFGCTRLDYRPPFESSEVLGYTSGFDVLYLGQGKSQMPFTSAVQSACVRQTVLGCAQEMWPPMSSDMGPERSMLIHSCSHI